MKDEDKLTAEAGAVTLTRREMVYLTGDNTTWGNFDKPPKRGALEYALNTMQACPNDLHVLSHMVETDFDADKLGMMMLRLAYKLEATESFVSRNTPMPVAEESESEAAE